MASILALAHTQPLSMEMKWFGREADGSSMGTYRIFSKGGQPEKLYRKLCFKPFKAIVTDCS
jgi:hypothetical protein